MNCCFTSDAPLIARVAASIFRLCRAARLAVLCCSLPAFAQEPPELEEVLVTGALEPLSARDVSSSVTVFTREDIERSQARTLAELLRGVPGFAVSQAGGPGTQTQVRVRGAEANHVLVLIDGMRANDPAANDEFQYQYASTADIERIEIIRGPQSAIWGTDALAGVINIIYRKDLRADYLAGQAEYGSFDSMTASVDGGIRLGNAQFSGGLSREETDGTNIARTGPEEDGARISTANATIGWRPAESLAVNLTAQHIEAQNDFDDFDFFTTGLPVDGDRYTEAGRRTVRADARWQPKGSRWSGSFGAGWLDTDADNYAFGAWESFTGAESVELLAKASTVIGDADDHRVTVALDHENVDFSQRGIATPFGDPNQDQSYRVSGYAAEYVGRPTAGLTWTLNARLDDFSDFEDIFTWQLAASQALGEAWRLRGSFGTGSKAPTFIERFGFYPDYFIGNPDLEPETSRGFELGAETQLLEDRFRIGIAYFRQELRNEIDGFVFDPATFLFTAANRDGDSERRGVETLVGLDFGNAFTVNLSYTYLDASEESLAGVEAAEIRRPRHSGSLNAIYLFGGGRGEANLNFDYSGDQLDNYFPPPFFASETVVLDGYAVVDVAVSWQLTPVLALTGRIENLFDEDYEEILGFARPGRALFGGLRVRFQR